MPKTVLVIDPSGESVEALSRALRKRGFEARGAADPASAASAAPETDAIFLAAPIGSLAALLPAAAALRGERGTPLVLATDLHASHWDETGGAPGALDVDALLGLPVDAEAAAARIARIVAARPAADAPAAGPSMKTIIDRAIANEEAAEAFYRRAAIAARDAVTRDALLQLSGEEKGHRELLLDFQSGTRPIPPGPAIPPTLASALACPDFTPEMTPPDAFLLAARKERLAVRFYEDWARLYPAGPERSLLETLAGMERSHQTLVEGMFTNAAFPESWG